MSEKVFYNLSGKTLVATPYVIKEGMFHKSLIYMLSHTKEGAIGLIFNRLVNYIEFKSFFKIKSDAIDDNVMIPIYLGGPVEHERGFFLHSNDYDKNLLLQFQNDLAVSSNSEISEDIAFGKGPKDSLFIVGYTAWKAGQLEQELENNLWLIMDCDKDFIFADHPENKWSDALKHLGIDEVHFAAQIGNA
ncbi:YqgE/AlgH family protein [Rickettsia endosymbiont of Polydrusus tereticollis]|uniref:YqgE/AlgH family protein n=1 Tax=Rickettsia endosymbiont of Polydrusus tereticollis TaxID=3066251 RepID=UPI003132E84F|nr:YqgE/AlgH family protein [Rickettsia endosymbiont of Oxypoda opaca]